MGEVRAREAKSERSAKDFMLAIVIAIDCAWWLWRI
jgi:hypothetical protein